MAGNAPKPAGWLPLPLFARDALAAALQAEGVPSVTAPDATAGCLAAQLAARCGALLLSDDARALFVPELSQGVALPKRLQLAADGRARVERCVPSPLQVA